MFKVKGQGHNVT